ncbi:hypothetical protein [Streptomyces sp. ODS28]|uniref:hypothetical protein n=1 Tax=Streptomyces sp. ODS28 TaxID=3136688 RepID=UPI0031E93CFD
MDDARPDIDPVEGEHERRTPLLSLVRDEIRPHERDGVRAEGRGGEAVRGTGAGEWAPGRSGQEG